jgi:hypothetical protein
MPLRAAAERLVAEHAPMPRVVPSGDDR